MGLLAKFLYKPLIKILEQRSSQIAKNIEDAKRSQEEARRYAKETHQALDMAKEEALRIAEQVRKDADSTRSMLDESRKESISIIDKAKKQIEKETDSARLKLKQDIANISLGIAKKILEKEITKKDHERLIDKSIKEMQ